MPDNNELTPEQELDDAFNEFAGDGGSVDDNQDGFDRPRDERGRFASNASDDELGDEQDEEDDLPLAAQGEAAEGDAVDQGKAQEPDLKSQLEQYRSEAQNWQHRYNSDLGRQSALQRKIDEQNRLIEQLQSGKPQPPGGDNPEGSGVSDAEWDVLKQDFPEIAQAVESRINSQTGQYQQQIQKQQQVIDQLQQQFQPIQEQAKTQYIEAQYNLLEQKHPDWRDVSGSNEFKSWVGQQPAAIQQLFENSESAADAAYLLDTYKLTANPAQAPKDALRERRQRQLQSSQTIPNRSARRTAVAEDDLDAAFDYYADRA